VFVVTRMRVPEGEQDGFVTAVGELVGALSARPGFRDAELGRAPDEPGLWALVTRWDGVGTYRRALSAADVKITGAPVWVYALDEPSAYVRETPGPTEAERDMPS
jgi:quinol monooxygenase YgiN